MSFLENNANRIIFLVQSGVAAWEDVHPIVDWRWKTVSICARRIQPVMSMIWDGIGSAFSNSQSVFRFHASALPAGIGRVQQRRLMNSLRNDLPGFSDTLVEMIEGKICVASKLIETREVLADHLSAYRSTILLVTDGSIRSTADLCGAYCKISNNLGGHGIARFLEVPTTQAVVRVEDHDAYAVGQFIGSSQMSGRIAKALINHKASQVSDGTKIHLEISKL